MMAVAVVTSITIIYGDNCGDNDGNNEQNDGRHVVFEVETSDSCRRDWKTFDDTLTRKMFKYYQ